MRQNFEGCLYSGKFSARSISFDLDRLPSEELIDPSKTSSISVVNVVQLSASFNALLEACILCFNLSISINVCIDSWAFWLLLFSISLRTSDIRPFSNTDSCCKDSISRSTLGRKRPALTCSHCSSKLEFNFAIINCNFMTNADAYCSLFCWASGCLKALFIHALASNVSPENAATSILFDFGLVFGHSQLVTVTTFYPIRSSFVCHYLMFSTLE